MKTFAYERADTPEAAVRTAGAGAARFIAGGTNLLDLMKLQVEAPAHLVDVNRLPLADIDATADGGLRIGALVRNSDLAADRRVRERYPVLSRALLAGASAQLRNKATTGGNLLQRTRCFYFYDPKTPCNKREPGSGCSALAGVNRMHAILGASEHCIAVHPSDLCVALAALDGTVNVIGPRGARAIPFRDFHRLPEDRPEVDTNLAGDELITSVDVPPSTCGPHFTYLKVRDRLSFAFALVSVAAALTLDDGQIIDARFALGGVAHKPWRSAAAEASLVGQAPTPTAFARAAELALEGAVGFAHNTFKIELARRSILRALTQAAAGTPQSQSDKRVR